LFPVNEEEQSSGKVVESDAFDEEGDTAAESSEH
jgi:hypothetical protein